MAQASAGAVRAHALGRGTHQHYRHRLGRHREAPPSRRARTRRARTPSSAEASSDDADDAAVERDVRAWLDTMVIGMNLCPFARAALPGTKILVASDVTDARSLREVIARELAILAAAPTAPPVTTLVVLPPAVTERLGATTHEGFMEGAYRCAEDAMRELTAAANDDDDDDDDDDDAGREDGDVIDIVPFHPLATFGGDVSEEDEEESRGYICTYLDVPDDEQEQQEEEEAGGGGGDGVRSPPTTEELRRMIEAHESFAVGADRRADWRAAAAEEAASDADAGPGAGAGLAGEERDRHPPPPVDPADFTGRSPHPVLHLLRRCDIAAADEAWYDRGPGTDIRAANAAALRAKGEVDLARMLRRCVGVQPPSR